MEALNEIKGFINFCTNKRQPNNQKIGCAPHKHTMGEKGVVSGAMYKHTNII